MNIAFFDVDETLIDCKSMFVFARFFFDDYERPAVPGFQDLMRTIRLLTEAGASRETVNAAYYRAFEGHRQDRVRAAARVLYDTQPFPLKAASVERLREHQQAGDEIVLVSGAMVDILHPLMDHLDVRFAYCSTPAVANGRYTGELEQRAVGEGKVQAVMQYCAMLDVPPARCSAYGDHISDAPLLCAVGRGHVVDPDAALASLAREKGWKALMTSGARLP
jgi:HAD superfamily hydrolase (TIGR01490 family)